MAFSVSSENPIRNKWNPLEFKNFTLNNGTAIGRYACLVLNHSLDRADTEIKRKFRNCWEKATLRVAVDGGANFIDPALSPPDFVSGDFDSISHETLEHFERRGSRIIPTLDQDNTDFTKAVNIIFEEYKNKIDYVVAISSMSNRIDHVMSNINTLITNTEQRNFPVFLYQIGSSLSWILKKNVHHSIVSNPHSKWCSLIPIGNPCTVTTTGLKWNLTNDKLEFGGIISSSNEFNFSEKLVTVVPDNALLWSLDFD